MIRPDGYVKVLDFGLAKLTKDEAFAGPPDAQTMLAETRDGVVMGTFNYMAPEQARGGDLDPRADLFALGVLLYEMLTGSAAVQGSHRRGRRRRGVVPRARAARRNGRGAGSPGPGRDDGAAEGSERAIPDVRGAAAGSPRDRSRRWTAGSDRRAGGADEARPRTPRPPPERGGARRRAGVIDSLAVLPLVNLGGDQELEYFTDGLTESLINNLSQIPRLRVMARSTVFRYKGQHADPQAVGRELGVRAVLTGSVAQRGDAFVVSAELVDADDGSQLWGTRAGSPRRGRRRPSGGDGWRADRRAAAAPEPRRGQAAAASATP